MPLDLLFPGGVPPDIGDDEFVSMLVALPLSIGEKVRLKKEWEYATGHYLTPEAFRLIRDSSG